MNDCSLYFLRMKTKKSIIALIFLVFSQLSFSQADSLWKIWKSNKYPDSTRLNALNDVAMDILFTQPDSAFVLAQIQIKYAHKKKVIQWESNGYNIQGISYAIRGMNKEALKMFEKCLELKKVEKDKKGMAATINNMALLNDNMGNYPRALELFFQSLKIKEDLKDTIGLASGYGNIAIVYDNIKEYETAYGYYLKGLRLNKLIKNKRGYAQTYHDMGINLKERGLIDSSLNVFLTAEKLFDELKEKNPQLFMSLGVMYMLKLDYEKSEYYLLYTEKLCLEYEDMPTLTATYGHLSDLFFRKKDYGKAIGFATKGFNLSKEMGAFRQILDNSLWLYKIYKIKSDPSNALKYFEEHIAARDTLYSEDKAKEMARYELKFDFEKKTAEDSIIHAKQEEISEAKIAQQDAEIDAKRNQQFLLFGGLALVFIFAIFMYNRFKVTQRQKNVIEEQKSKVEEQNVLIQHQKHEVEEKNKEITDSINYAKRIQEAILPSRYSLVENLKNGFVLYKPKDIVAGDFYWLEKYDNKVFFAAADCTGHGVPGAMVSVVCSNAISKALLEDGITETGKILDRTRELVIEKFSKSGENVKDGMDISLVKFEIVNNEISKLEWSGANNPLWLIRKGDLIEFKPDKQPIGNYADVKPFTTHQIEIIKGDTLYIFTDGYEDQFGGEKGKKFKAAKMKELFISIQDLSMEEQKEVINQRFEAWRGELEQVDDVCVIGVRI